MADRTVTISGLSKTYSITGWRLAYAIASERLTAAIRKVHDFLTVGAPHPLQEAGAVALYKLQAVKPLGALIEVELRHNQPHRATMFGVQVLTIMLDRNQHIVIIKISQRAYP